MPRLLPKQLRSLAVSTSPTQRTIRALKDQGRVCGIVERYNAHVGPHGIRQDLFGIIDIIALDPVRGVVGIQSCGNDFAAHWRKLTQERAQESIDWLSTPGAVLELWAWRKVKLKRGGTAVRWSPRVQEVTLSDIMGVMSDERDSGTPEPDAGQGPLAGGLAALGSSRGD